jgi:hypothetical protein
MMDTGGGHLEALSPLGPSPSESWMKTKSGFIFKDYGLVGSQALKFFLESYKTFGLPSPVPVNNYIPLEA